MSKPRSVVITGASRGLGLASAVNLYRLGWQVVGAMRSTEVGLERLREATGAAADDPRLVAVRLDLEEADSIVAAARSIEAAVGAPYALVHNAGLAAVGCAEEMPQEVWGRLFQTNLFGPVQLTRELLPAMRAAGRGRIVAVSSQGGVRGMPSIAAYSASKGALERWAEALAEEVAPFGLGVTVLVTGAFDTDIMTEQTPQYGDLDGPYATLYQALLDAGDSVLKLVRPPAVFARKLAKVLDDKAPFTRYPVGPDARMLLWGSRLLSAGLFHHLIRRAMGLPKNGALKERCVTG